MAVNKTIETLDLLKNRITALGCDFLGRVLGPTSEVPLKIIHIDHNPIGSEGVDKLANGLAQNKFLTILTLEHDSLDHKCAPAISRILIYIESKLKELSLCGNELRSTGLADISSAASIAKSLSLLDVSDNQIEDSQPLMDGLTKLLTASRSIRKLYIGNNFITNDFIRQLLQPLEEGKRITEIKFGVKIDPQIRLKLKATIAENKKIAKRAKKKKKKGKKGKKGKGKKKKK